MVPSWSTTHIATWKSFPRASRLARGNDFHVAICVVDQEGTISRGDGYASHGCRVPGFSDVLIAAVDVHIKLRSGMEFDARQRMQGLQRDEGSVRSDCD